MRWANDRGGRRVKITWATVHAIRESTEPHRPLARALGLAESTVRRIRTGEYVITQQLGPDDVSAQDQEMKRA